MFEADGRSDSFLIPCEIANPEGKRMETMRRSEGPRWEQKRRSFRQDGDWGLVGAVLAGFCRLLCVICES